MDILFKLRLFVDIFLLCLIFFRNNFSEIIITFIKCLLKIIFILSFEIFSLVDNFFKFLNIGGLLSCVDEFKFLFE